MFDTTPSAKPEGERKMKLAKERGGCYAQPRSARRGSTAVAGVGADAARFAPLNLHSPWLASFMDCHLVGAGARSNQSLKPTRATNADAKVADAESVCVPPQITPGARGLAPVR